MTVANKVQTLDGRWLSIDGRILFKATVAASESHRSPRAAVDIGTKRVAEMSSTQRDVWSRANGRRLGGVAMDALPSRYWALTPVSGLLRRASPTETPGVWPVSQNYDGSWTSG